VNLCKFPCVELISIHCLGGGRWRQSSCRSTCGCRSARSEGHHSGVEEAATRTAKVVGRTSEDHRRTETPSDWSASGSSEPGQFH